MWNPPESVHICRGRIRGRQVCEHCYLQIEQGQRYYRRIWRPPGPGRRRLEAFYEHADALDCHEEAWVHETEETMTLSVAIALTMVIKQVEVIALDVAGKPFTEVQSILTLEAVPEAEEPYPENDDDIPF